MVACVYPSPSLAIRCCFNCVPLCGGGSWPRLTLGDTHWWHLPTHCQLLLAQLPSGYAVVTQWVAAVCLPAAGCPLTPSGTTLLANCHSPTATRH